MTFTPKDGSAPMEFEVFDFPGAGVAMGMYNPTSRSATLRVPRCDTD